MEKKLKGVISVLVTKTPPQADPPPPRLPVRVEFRLEAIPGENTAKVSVYISTADGQERRNRIAYISPGQSIFIDNIFTELTECENKRK